MLADPGLLQKTKRCSLGIRAASRVSLLLPAAEWWVDDDPGPNLEIRLKRRLSRRVILGQKTTLGATDLL
jgi:hypothetical protein